LTVAGKDSPKAQSRGEHRARQQTCLRAPTPRNWSWIAHNRHRSPLAAAGVAVKPEAMTMPMKRGFSKATTACPQSPLRFDVAPPLSEARARIRLQLPYAVGQRLTSILEAS